MQSIYAYDVVYLDRKGIEQPLEVVWFYPCMERAQEHADEENRRLEGTRYMVRILNERKMGK